MDDIKKLEILLKAYAADRMIMNAAYGLYKDYQKNVESYENQIQGVLRERREPLRQRELDHLHELIEGKIELKEEDNA